MAGDRRGPACVAVTGSVSVVPGDRTRARPPGAARARPDPGEAPSMRALPGRNLLISDLLTRRAHHPAEVLLARCAPPSGGVGGRSTPRPPALGGKGDGSRFVARKSDTSQATRRAAGRRRHERRPEVAFGRRSAVRRWSGAARSGAGRARRGPARRGPAPVGHDTTRRGAARCGAVRCDAVRCGATRCGAVQCGAARSGPPPGGSRWSTGRASWSRPRDSCGGGGRRRTSGTGVRTRGADTAGVGHRGPDPGSGHRRATAAANG